MWDSSISNDDRNKITGNIGCSNAVAREAAPSSATDATDIDIDIAQRMAHKPVNLRQATSAMGRGPIQNDDGESAHRLEDDAQVNDDRRVTETRTTDKTPDDVKSA
jgi:hypothetical protein